MATELHRETRITQDRLDDYRQTLMEHPEHRVITNAIIKNGVNAVAQRREQVTRMTHTFSHEIPTGPITNQRQSGRCWLFAGLNVIRREMAQHLKLKDLELSQAYLMFYDKLEKANYFLESILNTLLEETNGRLISWLLSAPLQDGGQWDMFVNLVEKYGVVPKWVMPESFHSSESRMMNALMTSKLREDAARLRGQFARGAVQNTLRDLKEDMVREIYGMLCHFLGEPPTVFDFEYQDDDKAYRTDRGMTPVGFFRRYADMALDDYASVINAPTADKPFGHTYTVQYLGNVVGGRDVLYLNVPIEDFRALAQASLVDGSPVWFGCDVGKMSDRVSGILDPDQYDYATALGTTFHLTKGERLDFAESQMDHAMVLTGVNVVDGKPTRWKVENSWGKDPGHDGYFVMSDRWFDEYMYQVVVHKKYLNEAQMKVLEQKPIVLPPWDPMGSLA